MSKQEYHLVGCPITNKTTLDEITLALLRMAFFLWGNLPDTPGSLRSGLNILSREHRNYRRFYSTAA
jgi:hypothetical protein